MRNFLSAVVLAMPLCVVQAPLAQPTSPAVRQNCAAVTQQTCDIAHALSKGINMGNMLEAPKEGIHGLRLHDEYVDLLVGKFQTVRLPVRWSNHAAPEAHAELDEFFARRVDRVIDLMLSKGFYVILNVHHYSQLVGHPVQRHEFEVEPAVLDERLVNIWRQLGRRYKDRSPKLIFELLNEPVGRLTSDAWNQLAPKALSAVRESNPTRVVMIGPVRWNNPSELDKLRLPPDRNLIVSVHHYEPFNFTHQGATWLPIKLPVGVTCCDSEQLTKMRLPLDQAASWNRRTGYPIHLGEFGTRPGGDMSSRETWARLMRREMELRGIPWAYWSFASEFGLYDVNERAWNERLLKALTH